ncbi:SPOR domain-containing protein [Flammeovirga sp. EKP202]|uniref:HU domain-containing protein n=1 Tax=Flammeovirga sp. EKP202 TaxID=2770592 RepID=UPI00165EFF3D|nr:SPOR domain-containing protein [Flammeovirga sp. EKP202]MBD0400775.1 SPOR domain-containing protein [Flammeovirga sp. EKP202]
MIADAIKNALLDWGVVVIPDLGTFWSEESGAEVSPSGNIIKPPHVTISFSKSEDDVEMYSLVVYISKTEDLDEDEVAIQVSMFVANLQQRLEDGETAPIGDLGYFIQDDDEEIIFRQRNESNISPESFGLPKITATPLLHDEIEEEEEEYGEYEEEAPSKRPVWLMVSIPVIILLTIVGYYLLKPSTDENPEEVITQENVIEAEEEEQVEEVEETTITQETVEETPTTIEETKVEEAEVVVTEETTPDAPRNGNYHIVISSFGDEGKAEVAVKQAEKKGFDHVGIIVSKGKYRVALKGYNSHQEAKEALPTAQSKFKGAWIWRN